MKQKFPFIQIISIMMLLMMLLVLVSCQPEDVVTQIPPEPSLSTPATAEQTAAPQAQDQVIFTLVESKENMTLPAVPLLDEESARYLAEEAIIQSQEADYKLDCLIFDSAEKNTDQRDGDEFWIVAFRCTEECDEIYINCAAGVYIDEKTHEIRLLFPN